MSGLIDPRNLPYAAIPHIPLQITSTSVTAKPRKLSTQWSTQAANDFLSDFGINVYPRLPDNDLDLLRDALEDPDYDPNSPEDYKGLWRWEDGRIATPDEVRAAHPELALVEDMANGIKDEIDREIARELTGRAPVMFQPDMADEPPAPPADVRTVPTKLLNAIELTPVPRYFRDAARRIVIQNLAR